MRKLFTTSTLEINSSINREIGSFLQKLNTIGRPQRNAGLRHESFVHTVYGPHRSSTRQRRYTEINTITSCD